MLDTISYTLNFYYKYALYRWDNITPVQYGGVLIFIAVSGYLLMKGASR